MAVIETAQLRLRPGVAATEFVDASGEVERDYLSHRPGFNPGTRRMTVDGEGRWTISLRWDSAAEAAASMEAFMASPATARFLDAVEPSSMKIEHAVEVAPADSPAAGHVHRIYLDGIGGGRIHEAFDAHTGDHYTQHSTGVRDGKAGFIEFFEPFIAAHPQREITLVRTIVDGRYVFVHAAQELDGGASRWVTTDLFEVDGNERIVEHWDVIAAMQGSNPSGRTQIDGATEMIDPQLTEDNKDVVRRLLTEAFSETPTAEPGDFISAEQYLQHNTNAPDGLEALLGYLDAGRASGQAMHYERVHRVVGQGNFVAALSHVVLAGVGYAAFDLFRLEGGLVVEHWDAMEPVPSDDDLVNSGKF